MPKTIMIYGKPWSIEPRANGECPFVDRTFTPDPLANEPRVFKKNDGTEYIFYLHQPPIIVTDEITEDDPINRPYNVQFCKLCGRVRDVFRCLNPSEWHECGHHRGHEKEIEG